MRNRNVRAGGCKGHKEFADNVPFKIARGSLYLRLGAMKNHAATKGQGEKQNVIWYIKIIRWLIDHDVCLCAGRNRSSDRNHADCEAVRLKLRTRVGHRTASRMVTSLFEDVDSPILGIDGSDSDHDGESCSEEEDVEQKSGRRKRGDNYGLDDAWVRCRFTEYHSIEDLLDCIVKFSSFALVQTIGVGFFPSHSLQGTASEGGNAELDEDVHPDDGNAEMDVEGDDDDGNGELDGD